MKRSFKSIGYLCLVLFLTQSSLSQTQFNVSNETIKTHLEYLASDDMKGRDTPSPELDSSTAYIAREFKKYGLKPVGKNQTYFQYYNVLKAKLANPNAFKILAATGETEFEIKQDFVPIYLTANRQVEASVVFAGYGITAPEYNYDDYKNIDVNGKIVFIFTHEPQEKDNTSIFDGVKSTDHDKIINKAINAREHGAIGMIIVTDPKHRFRRPPNTWPSLLRTPPKDGVPLSLEEKIENKIVVLRIGKNLAEALLKPSGKTMADLQTEIDANLKSQSFEIPDIKVNMETNLDYHQTPTQNVVGLLEGSDPQLKDEVIVIGAHYDHLGVRNDTIIYNGADDNASGTVGVMAVAEAFANSDKTPKRSILFCAWSGEEKGLFGSRYYVDSDPLFPLEKTVTNLNMDMISRNDSSRILIEDINSSAAFPTLVKEKSASIQLGYKAKIGGGGGSDHMSFKRKEIPVLAFFTGFHPDYHQSSDTIDKCNIEGMSQVCNLVYQIAWELAENENRPEFTKK